MNRAFSIDDDARRGDGKLVTPLAGEDRRAVVKPFPQPDVAGHWDRTIGGGGWPATSIESCGYSAAGSAFLPVACAATGSAMVPSAKAAAMMAASRLGLGGDMV